MRVRLLTATAAALLLTAAAGAAGTAHAAARAACPVRATIYGTSGADTINGTAGADVICAGTGNDVINGRGGNDKIYGRPGNDTITTGAVRETIFAGSGNDVVRAGAGDELIYGDNPGTGLRDRTDTGADGTDLIYAGVGSESVDAGGGNDIVFTGGGGGKAAATTSEHIHGGAGNDVLLSDFRQPVGFGYYYGDAGSDLIWPNPVRLNPLGNVAIGGAGKDVIVLLNGLPDGAHMGDLSTTVKIPLGAGCSVTVPLVNGNGTLGCKLPIGVKVPGLVNGISVAASVDSSGKAKTSVDVKPSEQVAAVKAFADMAKGTFPIETCVCDPKLPGWLSTMGDTVYN